MQLTAWKCVIPDISNYFTVEPYIQPDKVIDSAESVVWCERWQTPGDFVLTMKPTKELVEYFVQNNLILTKDDTNRAMIPERIELTTDVKSGNKLKITGYSLESMPYRRIIGQKGTVTAYSFPNSAYAIGYYMQENIGYYWYYNTDQKHPANDDSRYNYINYLRPEPGGGATTNRTFEMQPFGENLGQLIADICIASQLGWRIRLDKKKKLMFYALTDTADKSKEIVFSSDFGNLGSTSYVYDKSTYYNDIIVGGEGEGDDRKVGYGITSPRYGQFGILRRQAFIDANSISSKSTSTTGETIDYQALLISIGRQALWDNTTTEELEGEALPDSQFKYRRDYDLGNIVTIKNDFGISRKAIISEVVETEDASGYRCIPKFSHI